jgi:hypothetical protein
MSIERMVEETWVSTSEGAAITGYTQEHLEKLAYRNWRKPEEERVIKIRVRTRRYELWLPDLLKYMAEPGRGPLRSPIE